MPPKLSSAKLTAKQATLTIIGQIVTGMVLENDGKKLLDEAYAKKLKHNPDPNYARKVRSLTPKQLDRFIETVHIVAGYSTPKKKDFIMTYFNYNDERATQEPYLKEYQKRGMEYIKKMVHENPHQKQALFSALHVKTTGNECKENEQIKLLVKNLYNIGKAKNEKVDENDEDFKNFVKEWAQDFSPLEEAIKREEGLHDPDLFNAILKDIHLRQTGRTNKYDIHTQGVIYKPMRGYRRNTIHSVQQIVDLDLFNKVRL